ncbi:MAG: tetratricopeptide repeat protein [Spirochaetaceae bacterium]|nr:tetratricopeptide repeat protein [Spirochaetaceae bacterium]
MTPHRTRLLFFLLAGFLILLISDGCRTWSTHEERAAQAFNQGNISRESGEYDDALAAYALALEYEPRMASAEYNTALTFVEMGRSGEALGLLQSLNQRDPRNLKIIRAMAWAAWKDGRVQASIDYYLSVLILSPGDKPALLGICEVYEASDRADEAVEKRKFLLEMDDHQENRINLARTMILAERYNEALDIFRILLVQNPGDKEALQGAALSAENIGLYRETISYLQALTDADAENGELWWNIATLQLVEIGHYDDGIFALNRALEEGFSDEDAFENLVSRSPPAIRASVRNILMK